MVHAPTCNCCLVTGGSGDIFETHIILLEAENSTCANATKACSGKLLKKSRRRKIAGLSPRPAAPSQCESSPTVILAKPFAMKFFPSAEFPKLLHGSENVSGASADTAAGRKSKKKLHSWPNYSFKDQTRVAKVKELSALMIIFFCIWMTRACFGSACGFHRAGVHRCLSVSAPGTLAEVVRGIWCSVLSRYMMCSVVVVVVVVVVTAVVAAATQPFLEDCRVQRRSRNLSHLRHCMDALSHR